MEHDRPDRQRSVGLTCPAVAHCVKKLLCAGRRGKGSVLDDLIGAEAALSRAVELEKQRNRTRRRANRNKPEEHARLVFDNRAIEDSSAQKEDARDEE